MSKRFGFRLGVSNDPNAAPPSLKEVLNAVLAQADDLMQDVLAELHAGDEGRKVHRMANVQHPRAAEMVQQLEGNRIDVGALFQRRLTDGFMHGGTVQAVHLHFDDLGLFGDEELSESVELARAQDEMSMAVDDVLPQIDAVMCTLLGWRSLQAGINPLRPEVFVRALRETLADTVPEAAVREALIVPAAGYMGVRLHDLYREVTDWLRSFGVEPALREGARVRMAGGTPAKASVGAEAQTMLTLDRLRHLLIGKLDLPAAEARAEAEFGLTVPASYEVLQQLKQVDNVVQEIERRSRADPAKAAARTAVGEIGVESSTQRSLGQRLGEEVVRLMFDNLVQDVRLLPAVTRRLAAVEPHLQALAQIDSRFFSDRQHSARQLLDRITQRSLAFQDETDEGCSDFLLSIDRFLGKLSQRAASAELFAELLAELDQVWALQDNIARGHRAEAALALLHVEQRSLLVQRLADELEERLRQREVLPFVSDFLRTTWTLVMAESRLRSADGSNDPNAYEALVEDLLWSVESHRTRQNPKHLAALIPGLLHKLRDGLGSVDYPEQLTTQFFAQLGALHETALEQRGASGKSTLPDARTAAAAASAATAEGDEAGAEVWVGSREAGEAGFIPSRARSVLTEEFVASQGAVAKEEPMVLSELRIGSWIELLIKEKWVRAQLTWASPHATLFMFTSASGSAHSMSKRTMERLRLQDGIRVVAEGRLLDQALDRVANVALRNSLKAR